MLAPSTARADLFRLLGDEDRLRLLALCAEEELTVGELAQILDESQPQITKKSQPLREAGLLALLSPLYERVIAVDRSPARLARCAARIAALGLPNVRLREGHVEDAALGAELRDRGGADLVLMARVLHHSARPQDAVTAA